jgi:polysaccharide biosynthesis/export protein
VRRRGSVASWLHGVALRVAASERVRAARRRHELLRAATTSSTTHDAGSDPVCDHELTLVIQEEIGRLPEKYRAPVVLCYLEGLTHEMAVEHLGWPVGSVNSRLAWARERLRVRLTRRASLRRAFLSIGADRRGMRIRHPLRFCSEQVWWMPRCAVL